VTTLAQTPPGPQPVLRTLAQMLRTGGKYRDDGARKYFTEYVASYYEWLAGQADVVTDSDAVLAFVGALVDNQAVRRAFLAALPAIQRLLLVIEAAERAGHGLRPPARPLRGFEDGSIGFDGAAPSAPPPPPAAAPTSPPPAELSPEQQEAIKGMSTKPAPKPPPTVEEVLEVGRQAHDAGELLTDCPYPAGIYGDAWEQGWKRAKNAARDARRYAGKSAPAAAPEAAPDAKPPKAPARSKKKPSTEATA
jgi:hypothetical protein